MCVYLTSQLKGCKDFLSGRTVTPRVTVVVYIPYFCNKSLRFKSGWTNKFLPDASIPQTIGQAGHGNAVTSHGPNMRRLRTPFTIADEAAVSAEVKQVKSNRNTYATSVVLLVLIGFARVAYVSAAPRDVRVSGPSLQCYPNVPVHLSCLDDVGSHVSSLGVNKVTVHPNSDVNGSIEVPSVGRDPPSVIFKGPTQGYSEHSHHHGVQFFSKDLPFVAPGTDQSRIQPVSSAATFKSSKPEL